MTPPSNQEIWQQVRELWQSDHEPAGLHRVFPPARTSTAGAEWVAPRCSMLDALSRADVAASDQHSQRGRELHSELAGLFDQLAIFESISRCPIVAITGLLNAGKSTLLASYLSPKNRVRVLRGLGNQAGTHRFVLWLPSVWWNDAELLSTLISFLTGLFGHAPEQLSEDPEQAALQYNGQVVAKSLMRSKNGNSEEPTLHPVDPLSVPLIAYDDGLDELRLGLIDCPDIQTGFVSAGLGGATGTPSTGSQLAAERREQLARVGRLCSAFVILSKLGSLHDESLMQILSTLRDVMPGVPRLLAVNKVKSRYSPEVVYGQARGLVDRFGISGVFAAYDFRSSLAHSRIPEAPSGMRANAGDDPQPIFFETGPNFQVPSGSGGSQAAGQWEYLFDLGNRLDAGTLSRESNRSLMLQLKTRSLEALQWLGQNQQQQSAKIRDAWQTVADACYEFMAERDSTGRATGLRLQASPAIVAQMADSLQRTAPAWMKISLSIDRTARQLHQAISNSASRFKILQSASDSVTQFAKRFRRGEGAQVVTPERLGQALKNCDVHEALHGTSLETLIVRSEAAIKRFAEEDKTLLDVKQLDDWSRQVWAGMSFKDKLWKGTQPLAVVMAPLLAAVLVPIDGGGSAVLVFASTKELLAAAGIAAVMAPMATGGEALRIVHRETPWRQLSDLFAILCDCICIPRPGDADLPSSTCAGAPRQLLPSSLESKLSGIPAAIPHWELERELVQQLQTKIQQLT